jgi:hypothetical protein
MAIAWRRLARLVYGDFVTDGLPAGGPKEPVKRELRELVGDLQDVVSAYTGARAPDVIVRDQQTANTDGGNFTAGSYATRTLNTSVRNVLTGASLASNQLTLPAGSYVAAFRAPAYEVNAHRARLYNVTAAAVIEYGGTSYSGTGSDAVTWSEGLCYFTLAAPAVIRVEHNCGSTKATTGAGKAANLTGAEFYAELRVWQTDGSINLASGVNGGAEVFKFTFSTTTTDADPGNGKLRLDNATQTSAANMFLDVLDAYGADITAVIDRWGASNNDVKAVLMLRSATDPSGTWLEAELTAVTSATGYRKLALQHLAAPSASPFADGDSVLLIVSRIVDSAANLAAAETAAEKVRALAADALADAQIAALQAAAAGIGDLGGDGVSGTSLLELGAALDVTAGQTRYYGVGQGGSTETSITFTLARAVLLRGLFVAVGNAPGSGQSYVVTLRRELVDTTLTVTIADTATSGSDTVDQTILLAGDRVALKIVASGGAATLHALAAAAVRIAPST